jgi:hypothetical protein
MHILRERGKRESRKKNRDKEEEGETEVDTIEGVKIERK